MSAHHGPAFPNTPLLRCPFCGSEAKWFRTGRCVGVECGDVADCPGSAQTAAYDPERAHDAACVWNQRHEQNADALGHLLNVVMRLREAATIDGELADDADTAISFACFVAGRDLPAEKQA